MDENMSESQDSQENISGLSPVASSSGSDSEYETIDVDEFLRKNRDPKWESYLREDSEDEPEKKPWVSFDERMRLREEREKEKIRLARARGPARLPDDYVPPPPPPPENKSEDRAARYKAWQEKLERIQREGQALFEENRRNKRAEYEMYAKLQKEYYPRDYYWKPDPLFFLHLKEMGYSKIAIDKALFYTDNRSVGKALEYLKKNPNPTELTKQEVMAAGEEVLKRIRPKKRDRLNQTERKESEMEIEDSQPFLPPDDSPPDGGLHEEMKKREVEPKDFVFAVPKPISGKIKGRKRRGIKRTYEGEVIQSSTSTNVHIQPSTSTNVHVRPSTSINVGFHQPTSTVGHIHLPESTNVAPPVPDKGEKFQLKMVFIVNASLLMDAVTLALEVGKVVANITSKLNAEIGKSKNMFDEWIKEGHKMWMFRGENSEFLSNEYKVMSDQNVFIYLSQCTHYRDMKTPSPTVLGVFGESCNLRRYNHLPML